MMELRFISGGIIIKRINLILIIIFSIFSCTGSREKIAVRNDRPKTEIKIYKQHWNLTQDLMNLFIHVELPINRFVFTKALDHFYSNLVVTMTLIDMDHDTQIFRDSLNEKIIQTFYEDTRNVNNYFSMEKNIELTPGKYKLFINVQDGDSRKNWRINEELHLKKIECRVRFGRSGFCDFPKSQNPTWSRLIPKQDLHTNLLQNGCHPPKQINLPATVQQCSC